MAQSITTTILKVVALVMAVVAIVLGILSATSVETGVTLLGIGLLALVLASF